MKNNSNVVVAIFGFCLLNILVFLMFNMYVSKRYIVASAEDLSKYIESEVQGNDSSSNTDSIGDSSVLNLQNQVVKTIEEQKDSVVSIVITKNLQIFLQDPSGYFGKDYIATHRAEIGGGSGIIGTKDGLIITNKHVVADLNADYTVILSDGETYRVKNVWRDPIIDIAVLELDAGSNLINLQPAKFVEFGQNVNVGQFVLAIGNALAEYQNSVSLGILSAKNRRIETSSNGNLYIGLYQTDTSINPGNSGGPLFDLYGKVLGINTAVIENTEGIGFALPVTQGFIDSTIESIKEYNKIERPFVGIKYIDLNTQAANELGLDIKEGTFVEKILSGSPADKAGIKVGDIILSVGASEIRSDLPFLYHIYQNVPGDIVSMKISRNGKIVDVNVKLNK